VVLTTPNRRPKRLIITVINADGTTAAESKSHHYILLRLTLALGSGVTRNAILSAYLRETLNSTRKEARRLSRR